MAAPALFSPALGREPAPVARVSLPRDDEFPIRAEALGFNFHTTEGHEYWCRDACYGLSEKAIDALERGAREVVAMCDAAADHVITRGDYRGFGFNDRLCSLIEASHRANEPSIYGRLDLRLGLDGSVKLYEYNAETPAVLLEAATIQLAWFQEKGPGTRPGTDQWSLIDDTLVERWAAMGLPKHIHFAAEGHRPDEIAQAAYLMATAQHAGHTASFLAMDRIGWLDGSVAGDRFVEPNGEPIDACFKLYPWDWIVSEEFGQYIRPGSGTRWFQPARRMVHANKALLATMWELFPGHPNLLPASLSRSDIDGPAIGKPALGLEGAGMSVDGVSGVAGTEPDASHTPSPLLWQAWTPPPGHASAAGEVFPVFGTWIIGDEPCGLGIREAAGPITTLYDRFVPHVVL